MQNPFTTTFSKAPEYTYISTQKTDEILDNFSYYSVYRDRLIKRGILSARQGYISLALPYFADYIEEYVL